MVVVAGDTDKTFLLPLSASCDLEEVLVVAGEECLLPQFTSTNSKVEEKRRYTVEKAKRIRGHQGHHEVEVSCGGEEDLRQHYTSCQKNPGHGQFIPVEDFKKKHLPLGYRDNVILDWIRAEADLTCRLSSNYTSESRPEFFPDSQDPYPFYQDRGGDWLRTGTGCVSFVHKYTEKDNKECECGECKTPGMHTPKKVWGEVVIVTASHLVFDGEEASHTFCHFSYDTSTTDVSQCPTLRGLKVECSDIKGDMCMMTCVTHDMGLVDKLVKMCDRRLKVFEKVRAKYWLDQRKPDSVSRVTDPTPGFVVVISHPHGCYKQISFGEWTHRQTEGEAQMYTEGDELKAEYVSSSYKYNAATCWGSSGAPVIRLLEKGRVGWWWLLYSHPHSGGDAGNNNYSGMMEEFVSFPPTINDKCPVSLFIKFELWRVVVSVGLMIILLAVIGNWEAAAYIWLPVCPSAIIALCYWLFPCFRVYRCKLWFDIFYVLFGALILLCMFVMGLVEDDMMFLKVLWGIFCVLGFLTFLLFFTFQIRNPFTSVKIQRRLRQRTRATKETATKPSESNMVTVSTNDNNNNSNNNSDTSTTVITTITTSNANNNNNNNNDNNYNTNTNTTTTNNNNNNDNKYVSFQRLTHTRI